MLDADRREVDESAMLTSGMVFLGSTSGFIAIPFVCSWQFGRRRQGAGSCNVPAQQGRRPAIAFSTGSNAMISGGKSAWTPEQLAVMERLRDDVRLKDPYAFNELRHLTDNIGPRLSGSPQAQQAVNYVAAEMRALGAKSQLEKATGPALGARSGNGRACLHGRARRPAPRRRIVLTALGGSVATSAEGLTAEVVVVDNWQAASRTCRRKR